jgi:hypothetical protein
MSRKELVQALEAKWGVKATYLGVPSCAYEIHCEAGDFLIDRNGVVKDHTGHEFSAEELLSKSQTEPAEEPEPIGREGLPLSGYAVELPMEGHTAASLRNLINMLASKEKLLDSAFGLTRPIVGRRLAEELCKRSVEDVESFQEIWSEFGEGHCPGFEMNFEKQTMAVKLVKENMTVEEMTAFLDLTVCMNENARKLKHSSYKPAQDDNPKFALRTWLLRLGMSGDAFKKTRKVLLARLSGSSAFRTPAEEEKHKARLLARKQKPCEEDGDVC